VTVTHPVWSVRATDALTARSIASRERLHRALSFAEIPDGRVSRLHCIVCARLPDAGALTHSSRFCSSPASALHALCSSGRSEEAPGSAGADDKTGRAGSAAEGAAQDAGGACAGAGDAEGPDPSPAAAYVEDLSTNGTFLNGERVARGAAAPLRDGDRLSLVLSVAPLTEQFFVFHAGARVPSN
jgi:hypothetical protein